MARMYHESGIYVEKIVKTTKNAVVFRAKAFFMAIFLKDFLPKKVFQKNRAISTAPLYCAECGCV